MVIPPDNRIPATIITGFLGSGKVSAPKYHVASANLSNEVVMIVDLQYSLS
jgi:G3E family GTPase